MVRCFTHHYLASPIALKDRLTAHVFKFASDSLGYPRDHSQLFKTHVWILISQFIVSLIFLPARNDNNSTLTISWGYPESFCPLQHQLNSKEGLRVAGDGWALSVEGLGPSCSFSLAHTHLLILLHWEVQNGSL